MWLYLILCRNQQVVYHDHTLLVCSFHLRKHWMFARKSHWNNNTRIKSLGIRKTIVGVAYFLKNLPAFRSQFQSPIACYWSYTTQSEVPTEKHFMWIKMLNPKIWERVDSEDRLIPSIEALRLHWMRARWVLLYWRQAQRSYFQLEVASGKGPCINCTHKRQKFTSSFRCKGYLCLSYGWWNFGKKLTSSGSNLTPSHTTKLCMRLKLTVGKFLNRHCPRFILICEGRGGF